ncbi:MAG TPA: hypothetical protein VGK35_09710 [Actinotalea sp.]|jgi:hypothetical protein
MITKSDPSLSPDPSSSSSSPEARDLRSLLSQAVLASEPGLQERLLTDPSAHLELIALSARARGESDELVRLSVASARSAGCTWEAIGGVLSMTRQAAQQRYGSPAAETPSEAGTAVGRTTRLAPMSAFNEMQVLERAGRYGWHSVAYGPLFHIVMKSDVQWEHERVLTGGPRKRYLEAQGWEPFGTGWFPFAYYKRRTGKPALPEPAQDDYVMRP